MKDASRFALVALAVILAACASARAQRESATAAPATYTFNCNADSPLNVALESFNFNLQNALSIGSQSSGAGAGKVTFNALTVKFRADGADTQRLLQLIRSGQHFNDCTLTEVLGIAAASKGNPKGSSSIRWVFRLVAPSGLTVIGSDASNTDSGGADVPTGFIEVNFEYGAVTVE